jgi:hypothetical protein
MRRSTAAINDLRKSFGVYRFEIKTVQIEEDDGSSKTCSFVALFERVVACDSEHKGDSEDGPIVLAVMPRMFRSGACAVE